MAETAETPLQVCRLGLVEYREALAMQERLRTARQAEEIGDVLLLLEHPPVYTRGRRSEPAELPMGEAWYRSQGIDVVDVDRGGKLTYHGPGQLVGYPIMRVTDVVDHLRRMETAIVAALAEEGIDAHARSQDGPAYTGVWVQDRKIASLGVHLSRGVTTHGFAVNVTNDLQPFEWAVPCGLSDVRMTSVTKEMGHATPGGTEAFTTRISACFAQAIGRRETPIGAEALGADPGAPVALTP